MKDEHNVWDDITKDAKNFAKSGIGKVVITATIMLWLGLSTGIYLIITAI